MAPVVPLIASSCLHATARAPKTHRCRLTNANCSPCYSLSGDEVRLCQRAGRVAQVIWTRRSRQTCSKACGHATSNTAEFRGSVALTSPRPRARSSRVAVVTCRLASAAHNVDTSGAMHVGHLAYNIHRAPAEAVLPAGRQMAHGRPAHACMRPLMRIMPDVVSVTVDVQLRLHCRSWSRCDAASDSY